MNNKKKQDARYYFSKARIWENCVCGLHSYTSDLVMNTTEEFDGILLRELALRTGPITSARKQVGSHHNLGMLSIFVYFMHRLPSITYFVHK